MAALVQQRHELRNGGKRTPLFEAFAPDQRVLAHCTGVDLVTKLFASNRPDRNVVDRDVPLRHLARRCNRRTGRRKRHGGRQARMLPDQRTARGRRNRGDPACSRRGTTRRNGRRAASTRRRRTARARGRCFVRKRRRALRLASPHLFEPVRRPCGDGHIRIALTTVD